MLAGLCLLSSAVAWEQDMVAVIGAIGKSQKHVFCWCGKLFSLQRIPNEVTGMLSEIPGLDHPIPTYVPGKDTDSSSHAARPQSWRVIQMDPLDHGKSTMKFCLF